MPNRYHVIGSALMQAASFHRFAARGPDNPRKAYHEQMGRLLEASAWHRLGIAEIKSRSEASIRASLATEKAG